MEILLVLFAILLLVSYLTLKYTYLAINLFYTAVPYNTAINIGYQSVLWLLYASVMIVFAPYLLLLEISSSLKHKWVTAHILSINKVFHL